MPRAVGLHLSGLASTPAAGAAYELRCDLEAPVVAIRYLLGLPLAEPVPPVSLRLGTTRGTNALITRSGARTALVTTRGFGDVLEIGYQARPRLFDLTVRKPPVLTTAVVEIDERVTHDGQVLASAARSSRAAATAVACAMPASNRWPFACCTRIGIREHERLVGQYRTRSWISRNQRVARRCAAAEVRRAGRYDGRRCVFESGAARVCRAAAGPRCRAARCEF